MNNNPPPPTTYARCPICEHIGRVGATCRSRTHSPASDQGEPEPQFTVPITDIEQADLYALGILTESDTAGIGNCTGCYRHGYKGHTCTDCNMPITYLTWTHGGYIDPYFAAQYYRKDFRQVPASNCEDKTVQGLDLGDIMAHDVRTLLDPTAATRGANGSVPADANYDENLGHGIIRRPRPTYYNRPSPPFGTDEYLLELITEAHLPNSVPFTEPMYIRLRQMTVGHIMRYQN